MDIPLTLVHTRRFLAETFRDPLLLALTAVLALFFMGLCALAYPRDPYPKTVSVVIDRLMGQEGQTLGQNLSALRTFDGRKAATVTFGDLPTPVAHEGLAPGADLEIRRGADGRPDLRMDALSSQGVRAANLVDSVLGLETVTVGTLPTNVPAPRNDFEAYTPGMMVFALLMMIPMTAVIMGRERRQGTSRRLRMAGMRASPYLAGLALSQGISALVLGTVLTLAAWAAGFPFGPDRIFPVFGVLFVLAMASVAQGLMVGAFVANDTTTLAVGQTLGMVQVVLSGSFFPLPSPVLWDFGNGTVIRAWDFIPATPGREALGQVLMGQVAGVWSALAATLVLAALWFCAAVVVYQRRNR